MTIPKEIELFQKMMVENIQAEKEKAIANYDNEIAEIYESNSVPSMLRKLVDVYHNNLEQKVKMVQILDKFLESGFFKDGKFKCYGNLEIVKGANYLHYKRGLYVVSFPGYRSKTIKLGIVNLPLSKKPTLYAVEISEHENAYLKKWISYKANPSKELFDNLLISYSKLNHSKKDSISLLDKMKLKYGNKLETIANEISSRKDSYEAQREIWETKMENYNLGLEKFNNFVSDLKVDLDKFEKDGWKIIKENAY